VGIVGRRDWRSWVVLGILLTFGLFLLLSRPAQGAPSRTRATAGLPDTSSPLAAEEQSMDRQLERTLAEIAGAGQVTVQVHLAAGPRTAYVENVQQTVQGEGGSSVSDSSRQLASTGAGTPVVQQVEGAQVDGVLVVATGAADPRIAWELTQAVEAATGAPAYRIVVLDAATGKGEGR